MTNKDAFDLWWEWADKPVDNKPMIDAAIHDAVIGMKEAANYAVYLSSIRDSVCSNSAISDLTFCIWPVPLIDLRRVTGFAS
jgi:hypothetical protein